MHLYNKMCLSYTNYIILSNYFSKSLEMHNKKDYNDKKRKDGLLQ